MKWVERSEVCYSTQLHPLRNKKVTSRYEKILTTPNLLYNKKSQVVTLRYDKKVTPPKKVVRQKVEFVVQKEGRKACRKRVGVAGEKTYWNQTRQHTSPPTLSHTIVKLNKTLRGQKNGSSPVAIVCHPL